ncbi:Cysteine desulfuration protein SufE [Thalassoglobus neptunius]|uniref:Cysteine desulfuration protein SufE n=1 Tax=Thalassoglobus neptunius TaxID=1938619 RepID=A0A5C5WIB2_9PLAN|nr:SufE family protein [Thalassoglobus neptunius]TWT49859.1 Cysteine desulfuration protein SufE [Thalassoglobus neptunius]
MSSASLMTLNELIEEFEFLGDWEARCDFLIDLGFELPKLPEDQKIEKNRVHGCQSNVWLVASMVDASQPGSEGSERVVELLANSDAMIVNGLIAVLMAIYNHKTPKAILATDVEEIFKKLELDRHLSPARKNGLFGMVKKVRQIVVEEAA